MPKPRLLTVADLHKYVSEATGKTISDVTANDLIFKLESHVLGVVKKEASVPKPPYRIVHSRNLSGVAKEWLADNDGSGNKFSMFRADDNWVGKLLTKHDRDPEWDDHKSYLFLRKEMWGSPLNGEADENLHDAFHSSSLPSYPRENYPLEKLRKGIARDTPTRKSKRVRIPKSRLVLDEQAFQAVHLPDDEGCYSLFMDEPHAMKTFFRGNHGEGGDEGEISFWWSDLQDIWVLWTDWVRWVIHFE